MPPRPENPSSPSRDSSSSDGSSDGGAGASPKVYGMGAVQGNAKYVTEPLLADPGSAAAPYIPPVPINNTPQPGESYKGFIGDAFPGKPLWQRLNWIHVPLLLGTPIVAAVGVSYWKFDWRTFFFAIFYYFFSGLGITAGSLRLCIYCGRGGPRERWGRVAWRGGGSRRHPPPAPVHTPPPPSGNVHPRMPLAAIFLSFMFSLFLTTHAHS